MTTILLQEGKQQYEEYGSIPSLANYDKHAYVRRRSSLEVYQTFLSEFRASNGGWFIILLGFLTALGIGGLIGVVPEVAMQRFAEKEFGLSHSVTCSSFASSTSLTLPLACVQGRDYAQDAASFSSLARNLVAILANSLAGSYSDTHGRRGVQITCLFLTILSPISFYVIQTFDTVHPTWYYFVDTFSGVISYFSIAFTQLSDIMPPKHRAAAYGLYWGAFMAGIAIAPYLATRMNHIQMAVFASVVRILALVIAIFCLPETLPTEHRNMAAAALLRQDSTTSNDNDDDDITEKSLLRTLLAPLYKMEILLRSRSLLLVAFGAFCSRMVHSADVTLFFYYAESNLNVQDKDVAKMMFMTGVCCVLIQAGFFKYFISLLGERRLLVTSFACGVVHNLLYGFAPQKWMLYVGLVVSSFTQMDSSLLSSVASRNVGKTEQGQIQGALFGLGSLAEAIGPITCNFVYHNWHTFGHGTMFVGCALVYAIGTGAVSLVPPQSTIQQSEEDDETDVAGVNGDDTTEETIETNNEVENDETGCLI